MLVVGAPVAMALKLLGVPERRVAAILFIIAGLGAAAPPVNIWAMILCAGTAIPYVGFSCTLGIPVLILGTFTMLILRPEERGRRSTWPRRSGGHARGPGGDDLVAGATALSRSSSA